MECGCCIDETAETPFGASMDWGRAVVTPATGSALSIGHGLAALGGFLRRPALVQVPTSPAGVIAPLDC